MNRNSSNKLPSNPTHNKHHTLPKESQSKIALKSKAVGKVISSKGKMRVRLPGIESFEKELEFVCDGPSKVVVRLEHLMGSSRARINDARYMGTLLKKLEEEEDVIWGKRKKLRRKKEKDRYRQLIIEGKIDPSDDQASKEICRHPIYRVNRLLNRINNLEEAMSPIVPNKTPPRITPTEPFHEKEYLECGILFGFHEDHYRRARTAGPNCGAFLPKNKTELEIFLPPTYNEEPDSDNESEQSQAEEENAEELSEEEDEEWGGEDYPGQNRRSFLSTIFGDQPRLPNSNCGIQDLLKRGSVEHTKHYCGFGTKDNLDKWKVKQSPLIDELFQNEEKNAMEMYEFSKNLLEAYQREQLAMDNFVNKSYRKYLSK